MELCEAMPALLLRELNQLEEFLVSCITGQTNEKNSFNPSMTAYSTSIGRNETQMNCPLQGRYLDYKTQVRNTVLELVEFTYIEKSLFLSKDG